MSQNAPPRPRNYKPGSGNNRYARFAEDWLDVKRTYVLDTILDALDEHQQVLVLGGNGVGKSFFVGVGGLSALYCNPHTIVHVTAGTSTTLKNNIWKPTRGLFKDAKKRWGDGNFPGRYKDGTREILTEIADKWYFECISPKYPDDLEGPHNNHVIYFIEEADKPGVTAEHVDSVRSTVTDENDRVCIIANPPTDDGDIVAQLLDSDEWHVLRFPSWDSHNVRIERGLDEGEKIGGLATAWKIQNDWEEYHDEPWPGLEQAIRWSTPENEEFRTDLHERWYKRRASIIPPDGSDRWRPWSRADVEAAYKRDVGDVRITPEAYGLDVARKVDETIGTGLHGPKAIIDYRSQSPHPQQREELVEKFQKWPEMTITVDAIGKGEPIAEELDRRFPKVRQFGNNQKAIESKSYRYKWDEGLYLIGEWLRSGGSFEDQKLYEELKVGASVLEFEEKGLSSRGGKIIQATKKEKLKDALGHSPDRLDSLLMAIHGRETEPYNNVPLSW